jgi:hypothetical protein
VRVHVVCAHAGPSEQPQPKAQKDTGTQQPTAPAKVAAKPVVTAAARAVLIGPAAAAIRRASQSQKEVRCCRCMMAPRVTRGSLVPTCRYPPPCTQMASFYDGRPVPQPCTQILPFRWRAALYCAVTIGCLHDRHSVCALPSAPPVGCLTCFLRKAWGVHASMQRAKALKPGRALLAKVLQSKRMLRPRSTKQLTLPEEFELNTSKRHRSDCLAEQVGLPAGRSGLGARRHGMDDSCIEHPPGCRAIAQGPDASTQHFVDAHAVFHMALACMARHWLFTCRLLPPALSRRWPSRPRSFSPRRPPGSRASRSLRPHPGPHPSRSQRLVGGRGSRWAHCLSGCTLQKQLFSMSPKRHGRMLAMVASMATRIALMVTAWRCCRRVRRRSLCCGRRRARGPAASSRARRWKRRRWPACPGSRPARSSMQRRTQHFGLAAPCWLQCTALCTQCADSHGTAHELVMVPSQCLRTRACS